MNEIPRIKLSLGTPYALKDISQRVSILESEIKTQLEKILREHYYHFASKPFILEYDPREGYIIRATSSVGMLKTDSFIIDLQPKIPEISIGKCLGLAQESNISLLHINDRNLTSAMMSPSSTYSTIDFLGFSLVDSVIRVRNNGFARKFEDVYGTSLKLRGNISANETIKEGKPLIQPITEDIEASLDIYPNQLLKFALNLCINQSESGELKRLCTSVLESLKEVRLISETDILREQFIKSFSLPRPDYETALAFAKAIIEGRLISDEENTSFIPSFTLDMDRVFEGFCSYQLQQVISTQRFNVYLQGQFKHEITPNLSEKKITPDIVIEKKDDGKKIILDLKNKYSTLRNDGSFQVSNNDLFQLAYYSQTLQAEYCILVYPGSNPSIQYPLRGSEGDDAYMKKRQEKFKKIKEENLITVFSKNSVKMLIYNIDIQGTMQNTKKSIASLGQLAIDILNNIL